MGNIVIRLLSLQDESANANACNRPDGLLDADHVPIEKLVDERRGGVFLGRWASWGIQEARSVLRVARSPKASTAKM